MKGKIQLFIVLFLELAVVVRAQIHRPTAWLRADSAFLSAPTWIDVSGNGLYAVPSSGFMPSEFSRMNFNKCFEISGAETFSLQLGINDSRQSDVIVVYETYDTADENALWQVQLDTTKRIGQTTQRILNDNGRITYDSVNRLKPVVNYLSQSWLSPEACAPTLTLCAADTLLLHGRIAEALCFDSRISDTAVIQWISYLAVKYGVTLAQTDYLDSRRNTIWDFTHYPDYCASIAGVGRDDSVGLHQKQSCFADGRMVFGVGQLANTNEENPSVMADGDFVILGCRDEAGTVSTIYTQDGTTCEVVFRSMAQVTGHADTYSTFILLDTATVQDSVPSVLLIDRSGTGEFPAGQAEQVLCAGTDTAGHFIYPGIHWDTDLSGRDFFCFAVAMSDTMDDPKALSANGRGKKGVEEEDVAHMDRGEAVQNTENGTDLKNTAPGSPQYRLSPNPNHGRFAVEAEYPVVQDVTVAVHDSDGKLLLAMTGKGQRSYRFEGAVPTAGHYLIDIISPSEHKTLKMVVN